MMQNRLYKSRENKVVDGVCGGVAEYFQVDAVLIRLIFVVGTILTAGFWGIIAYLIAMVIIPVAPKQMSQQSESHNSQERENMDEDYATDDDSFQTDSMNQDLTEQSTSEQNISKQDIMDEVEYEIARDPFHKNKKQNNGKSQTVFWFGLILLLFGAFLLVQTITGIQFRTLLAPFRDYLWPIMLLVIGLILILTRSHKSK